MKLESWQIDMMKKLQGVRPGEMAIMMSGRRVGKSAFSAQALKRLMDDIWYSPVQNIVLAEGTVYGSRYYTAEPIGGNWREITTAIDCASRYYTAEPIGGNWREMEAWCFEHFGGAGERIWGEEKAPKPAQRWYMNNRKFWFRDEQDRMVFVLKWR